MIRIREIADPELRERSAGRWPSDRGMSAAAIPDWFELDDLDFVDLLNDLKPSPTSIATIRATSGDKPRLPHLAIRRLDASREPRPHPSAAMPSSVVAVRPQIPRAILDRASFLAIST
jgi:hypothetical protein